MKERFVTGDNASAMTPTSALLSGSHNVMTVSAATARTDPSAEKAAAVIGFFLYEPTDWHLQPE
uniref:Uncharacterized protein n=1 Tax=Arundo donax TaxID=35708 RepID=A0A0A9CEK7_ARUDO